MQTKRFAIVGTAQSWAMTPWNDPGIVIASLNDAYRLKGFVRADRWYDTHPLNHFYFTDGRGPIMAHQVPPGYYVRPAEHLQWLGSQAIPVYLNPDYLMQYPAAKDWKSARALPWADIEVQFGRYFTSSPALIMAHAMLEGFNDISIYGIHLATESEYIDQRPQFEFLIGRMLGPSKMTMTVKDKMRHYETSLGHVALPEASPVLQADYVYSFETKPRAYLEPMKWDAHRFSVKRDRALRGLTQTILPWKRAQLKAEAQKWDAYVADVQEQMQRFEVLQRVG